MKLRHFSISQQGDSHIKTGKNCQDYSGTISAINPNLKMEFGIAAIADGVGSCDYSEVGSQIAVTTVLKMLKEELSVLQEVSEKSVLPLIKKAFLQANENIEHEADEKELPFLLFDTTLTVIVLTDKGTCYVGHIGDDGVVALMSDGSYSMITQRIEGEEANSVFPLSSTKYWTFGVVKKPVAALALMTDGLLDKSVGSTRMNNRVYYPFFKPMFENIMETDQDVIDLRAYWDSYLQEKEFRAGYGVTDDITLAVVQLPLLLKNVKPIPFDEEKWLQDSEAAKKEIEEALNEAQTPVPENTYPAQSQQELKPAEDNTADNSIGAVVANTSKIKDGSSRQTSVQQASRPAVQVPLHNNPSQRSTSSNSSNSKTQPVVSRPQTTSQNTQNPSILQNTGSTTPPASFHGRTDNTSSFQEKNPSSNRFLRIILPVIAVVLLVGVGLLSRSFGYNAGLISGKQQEQAAMQEKMDNINAAHEEELTIEYERGYQAALAAHEEELTKEYERGYQAALEQATTQPEETAPAQAQMIRPEEFIIERGQKGDIIRKIQKLLRAKGWNIKTDADFGRLTETAVYEFQQLNDLTPTGKVDILTFWMLANPDSIGIGEPNSVPTPTITATPAPTPVTDEDLSLQDELITQDTIANPEETNDSDTPLSQSPSLQSSDPIDADETIMSQNDENES